MTDPDSFADDVPVADALEQALPAVHPPDADSIDPEEPPLESDASDWQEQRLVVEDPEEDFRE